MKLIQGVILHIVYIPNNFSFVYVKTFIYIASSEQSLVVLVVQATTLELSILLIALQMEGMLQSQVVATST